MELNRRAFVQSATLGLAALTTAGAAAAAIAGEKTDEKLPAAPGDPVEYACDLAVIGTGGSGMCAVIEGGNLGMNVIAIEQLGFLGGGLYGVEAHYTLDCKPTQDAGMSDQIQTPMEAFDYHMGYNRYRANAKLVRQFVEHCSEQIDWLVDEVGCTVSPHGVLWGLRGPGGSAGIMFLNEDANGNYAKGGIHLANRLTAKAQTLDNVRFLTETHADALIRDEDGRVTGVRCTAKDGSPVVVNAGAVVVATGGFANSYELLEKYCGRNEALASTTQGHTVAGGMGGHFGEGIQMCWEVGAAEEGMRYYDPTIEQVEGEAIDTPVHRAAREPYLYVNKFAKRFSDESHYKILYQPDGMYYSLFDADMAALMESEPTIKTTVYTPSHNNPIEGLANALEEAVAAGRVYKANSIEELAEAAGLDAPTLAATVQEYNDAVDAGEDWWFNKDVAHMHKVQTAPFYLCGMICGILNTCGGVRVSEGLEAMGNDYLVIPGLYVVGNDAGGCYGDQYNHLDSGWASSFAFWSGREAARQAQAYEQASGIAIDPVMPESTAAATADQTGAIGADGIATA